VSTVQDVLNGLKIIGFGLVGWWVVTVAVDLSSWLTSRVRKPMSGKRYGTPQSTRLPEPFEFELMASLDDVDEVHQFRAVRQVDRLLAAQFTGFVPEEAHKEVALLVKLISKTLDDKDGTPATWAPVELPPPPANARDVNPVIVQGAPDETALAAVRLEQTVTVSPMPKFRGPDGALYEMEHAEKFAAFEAGSSRRRFLALCGDQERTVQGESLGMLVRDLIAVSAGRPTGASSPSLA
jgi:hypothetical protein